MNSGLFDFNGEKFPFREVILFLNTKDERIVTVAGKSLYETLKPHIENKNSPLWFEATDIDDSIEYYVDDKDLSKGYFDLAEQVENEAYR